MRKEKLEDLANQIVQLTPNEKGLLFSMFFEKEKENMNGDRKKFYGILKTDKEITDEDINSCLYNPDLDDLMK